MPERIRIFLIDLPAGIKSHAVKNEDESFTILINAQLSGDMQIAVYDREIKRIERGDYDKILHVRAEDEVG